jgi:uncharacterized protein (DUF362 family)/NAD-dependent dihydropyrimidine dehydrogenase PreA subunit
MNKSTVAVVRCETYHEDTVFEAVKRGIELIGGAGSFAKSGEKILLKPNVLVGDNPERCISTHPAVLKAAGRVFKEISGEIFYGDSSGFGKSVVQMKKAGLSQAADEMGIKLADFITGQEVSFPDSPYTKKFVIANGALDTDGLISLAKLKTHQLNRMTGAVKNQFGCIPGMLKAEYHLKVPHPIDFSKMLVALNLFLKPRLYIMDGIMAMEGNGPRTGDPVAMNVMLFSKDPVALDAVACRMIDLNVDYVPTMKPGKEWGLGVYGEEEIKLVGDPVDSFVNKNFNVVRKPVKSVLNNGAVSLIKNLFTSKPYIIKVKCTMCGTCVKSCPADPKALSWKKENKKIPPVHTYTRCIRCFCCQELCPEGAIHVKTPLAGRLIFRGG